MKLVKSVLNRWSLGLLMALITIPLWGDGTSGKRIAYRRIYAPVDRLADWPRGKTIYKPMDADDFERWASGGEIHNAKPQVTHAQFSAVLEGKNQLTGKIALQIQSPSEETHVLPLSPFGVALADLEWERDTERVPAQIGSDAEGRLFLFVNGSGTLRGRWSVRGRPDRAGQLEFQFLLPPSITKKFELDLPEGLEPDLVDAVTFAPVLVSGDLRRWDLQIPGQGHIHLRILRDSVDPTEGLNLLKQSLAYEFQIDRMQLDQELSLNIYRKPLRQIILAMDTELRLIEAFLGDQPVEWLEQEEADTGSRKLVLQLPEPITGSDRVVRLRAMAEPVYDRAWKLPRITPQGFSWQEGVSSLLVAAPLVVEQMRLTGCQQLRAGKVPGSVESEIFEIQDQGPDAEAEILLVSGRIQGNVDSTTSYTFTDGSINGRMVCDVRLAGPAQFKIQAEVAHDWKIESILAHDAGVIERWRQEETDSGNQVTIFLRRGITASRPLRLEITGRKNRPLPTQQIELTKLQMLQFKGMRSGRALFELTARDPYRVRVTRAADFRGFSFAELTPEDQDRVGDDFSLKLKGAKQGRTLGDVGVDDPRISTAEASRARFWYDSSQMGQMEIRVEKPTPRFSTETRIEAQVGEGKISEQCVVECTPQESGIDSLQIVFSQGRAAAIRCSVVDQNGVVLDGVRASPIPMEQGGAQAGETWLVRWNRPLSEKFQLIINRTTGFDHRIEVALVGVPQAFEQRATVAVLSGVGHAMAVNNQGLKALPVQEGSHFVRNPMRARFRYNPERDVRGSSGRRLNLTRHNTDVGSAIVWRSVAESWFAPTGEGIHRVTYYLENEGRGFFTASLEQGNQFRSAEVDGVQVRLPSADTNLPLTIALSENQRFSVVELQWSTSFVDGWLPWIRQVPLPLPRIDIPVIAQNRIIHAPPGFVTTDSLSGVGADRVGLSWRQRLFGPIARLSSTPVFDPFDSSTWSNIPLLTVDDDWRQRGKAEKILDQMGRVLSSHPQTASWADFTELDKIVQGETVPDARSMFIDLDALAAVGIGPETPIQVYPERSPRRLAVEALRKANLVVAFNAQSWLLSTVESLQPADAAWLIDGVVCRLDKRKGPFADLATFNPTVMPLRGWRDEGVVTEFPWKAVWRDGFDFTENQGGSTLYLDGAQADLSAVQLVDVEALRGLQWTLFSVVVLAGCLWGPDSIRKGVFCLLCLAIAALILPAMLAPLATAAFCAAGVAFLWKRFYPLRHASHTGMKNRRHILTPDLDSITQTMRVTGSEVLLLFLSVALGLGCFSAMRLQAMEAPEVPPAVVIPIDEQNKKVGDTYYLSSTLFDAVHQESSNEKAPLSWLLTKAQYRLVFNWTEDRSQIAVGYCVAQMQIEVLGHQARIELPFGGAVAEKDAYQLTVDGKVPGDLSRVNGRSFSFTLDEPGIYLINARVPVRMEEVGGMRRVDCTIPPLVTSQLEIDFPAEAVPPEVLSARGSVEEDKIQSRLKVQLGDVDRIIVQWQEDEAIAGYGLADVDQLVWMKVQPGAVVVDARFKLNIEDRRIQRVQIATDPELRLLSPLQATANGEPIELTHLRTVAGDPQTIDLQWSPGVTGNLEIRAPFLWAGVSGVGNIRIPDLEVKGSLDTRRWVAVSVDPTLTVDRDLIPQDALLRPLSSTTAGEIWDLSDQSPDFFYEQTGSDVDWSLPARLQESETIGYAKLALGVSDTVSEVFAEYELETTDGHRCQYQVELPAGFVPENVEMLSGDVDRLMRWSVRKEAEADRLTLFLAEPVRGSLRLMLRGHLTHPENRVDVPRFLLKGVRLRGGQVAIYRQPAVQIALKDDPEVWQPFDDFVPMAETPPGFGRFVGVYALRPGVAGQTIKVTPNQIDAEAIQVTSLNRIDSQWNVEVDLQIKVYSGQLDTVRFRIPNEFQGPFQIDPEVPFLVKELPEDEGFVLDMRLPEAVDGSYRLTLRGTLNIAPEDPVRCPAISVEEIDSVSRFVVLPKKVDFQDVSWKTSGLVPQSLPEDPDNAPLANTSVASFKVIDPTFRAVLQSVDQPAEKPEVQLADVAINGSLLDRYLGRAVFDLDPAGLAKVGIRLPDAAAELLRIRVNDRPTTLHKSEQGWDIELHSRNLLQRVEVLYSAPYSMDGDLVGVSRPSLTTSGEAIPIAQSLWSLSNSFPLDVSPAVKDQGLAIGGSVMQYEYLQKRTRNLLEALADVTSAEPMDVLLPWYTRTVRRLVSAQREMENLLLRIPTESVIEFKAKQVVLAEQVRDVAAQLVDQGVFTSIDAFEQIGVRGPDPWQGFFSRPASLAGSDSDEETVFIRRPANRTPDFPFRWLLATTLSGVVALMSLRPQVAERLLCCGLPLVPVFFTLALFYWLFLSPSVIGFFAMLVAVVLALVLPWNWAIGEQFQPAEHLQVDSEVQKR